MIVHNKNRVIIRHYKITKGSDHIINSIDLAKFVFNVTGKQSVEHWLKLLMNKDYVLAAIEAAEKQVKL